LIVENDEEQFLSPIFLRPKPNGEYRMILNLEKINEFVPYHHFKMDTFEIALKLINKKYCYGQCRFEVCTLQYTYCKRTSNNFEIFME
jgi:hypothetical protein